MATRTHAFLLSTIFMLLMFNSNAENPPSELVKSFCSQTSNPADCFSALKPDPRTTSVSTFRDLAQIALELAIVNTTKSQTFIKNMLKRNDIRPPLKYAIESCFSSYGLAIASFRGALTDLDVDSSIANYEAKAAGDGASDCENIMAEKKVNIPPSISTGNSYLMLYSSIGFAITSKL